MDYIYSVKPFAAWQADAEWFVGYGDIEDYGYVSEMLIFPLGFWGWSEFEDFII